MKLADLNPRWFALESDGPRVGLGFDCPHCRTQRLAVLFHHSSAQALAEDQYIRAHHPGDQSRFIYTMTGSTFDDLSLSPSVDASSSGHWHGFITNGEIR